MRWQFAEHMQVAPQGAMQKGAFCLVCMFVWFATSALLELRSYASTLGLGWCLNSSCTSAAAFVQHVAVGDQLRPAVCHAALQSPFNTLICTRIGKGLCMFGEICVHVGHVYSRFTNHSHPLALCFPVFRYIYCYDMISGFCNNAGL